MPKDVSYLVYLTEKQTVVIIILDSNYALIYEDIFTMIAV